jgi:hypothetical protein
MKKNLSIPKYGSIPYLKWLTVLLLLVCANWVFAQTPPQWQSSATNTGDASSASVGKPSGLAVGDLMVVAIMVEKGSVISSTAPTGWTLIRSTNASTDFGMRSYWKIAVQADVDAVGTFPFSFPLGTSGKWTISNSRITGYDTTVLNPINVSDGQAPNNNGSGVTVAPSITTTVDNTLVLAFFGIKKGVSEPASITDATKRHFRTGNDVTNLMGSFEQITAGETGNRSVTFNQSEWRAGQQIAIRPLPPVLCLEPEIDNPGLLVGCDQVILPEITGNNLNEPKYYNDSQANGGEEITELTLTTSQTVWIFDSDGDCSDEVSFEVTVNQTPVPDSPEDVDACDVYILPELTVGDYFSETGGTGTAYNAGDEITTTMTMFVYAANADNPDCNAEESFEIRIFATPVPDSPEDVDACDVYILPELTVGDYFSESGGTGTAYNAGDEITTTMTMFVFAENADNPDCNAEESFEINIHPSPILIINIPEAACAPNSVDLTDPSVTDGSTLYGAELSYWLDEDATVELANPDAVDTPGTYYIKALTEFGCFDIQPVTVSIIYAPEWVSSETNVGKGGSNPVVNRPIGTQAGDLLVIGLMVEKGTGTSITAPAGWISILRTNRTTDAGMETYYKVATEDEPSSYTFRLTNSPKWAIGISRITGADTNDPIMVAQGASGGQVANAVAPSITTDGCNTLVMAFYSNKKDATFSTPTGTTKRYDHPNKKEGHPSNMLATYVQEASGATGTKTATASEKENWVAQQIGIRAAAPGNQDNLRVLKPQNKGSVETVFEMSETYLDTPTGGSISDVRLYPTPSQGLFTIELPWNEAKDVEVNVYNSNGVQVFQHLYGETSNKVQVDISRNLSGLYLVTVQVEGQSVARKLIIQK